MSGRSFRSVFMVASCAGAALGCYLVSLRVASERAAVETVETQIVLAQRDIRLLQTEIGTRGRLAQLERWNVKVLALSAPSADQFVDGGFALARMATPERKIDLQAPVVLASAPTGSAKPQVEGVQRPQQRSDRETGASPQQLMHTASITRELPRAQPARVSTEKPEVSVKAPTPKTAERKAASAAPKLPAKKSVDKHAASAGKPVTKATAAGKSDPLAPLAPSGKPSKLASATSKESAKKQ
jgi:hypothetical protein